MANTLDKIKDNMSSVTAIASTIGLIIGGWLIIDERYAHAQEVKAMQSEQAKQIKQLRIENTQKFYRSKIDDIDQKKFEIEVKPAQTQIDKVYIQRYDKKISELKQEEAAEIQKIEQGK